MSEQFDARLTRILTTSDPELRPGWRDRALSAMKAASPAPPPSLPNRWFTMFTGAARWQQATVLVGVLFMAIFVRQLVFSPEGMPHGMMSPMADMAERSSAAPGMGAMVAKRWNKEMAASKAEGRQPNYDLRPGPMTVVPAPQPLRMGPMAAKAMGPTQPSPAPQAARVVPFNNYGHKLIMASSIGLETKDVRTTYDRVQALAVARGIIIASASLEPGAPTKDGQPVYEHAIVVLRPPQMEFDRVRQQIMDMAATSGCKVLSDQVNSEEVTGQYTDLTSRLKHWRSQEAQLLGIMRQARRIPDILSVRDQLVDVQQNIEQISGELNALKDRVSLASITVDIRRKHVAIQAKSKPKPVAGSALSKKITGAGKQITAAWSRSLQDVVSLIGFLLMVVTYLLPFAVIAGIIYLPIRAARKRSTARAA